MTDNDSNHKAKVAKELSVLKSLQSFIALGTAVALVCVWSYTTFATKEQLAQLTVISENNHKDTLAMIDSNKRDSLDSMKSMRDQTDREVQAINTSTASQFATLTSTIASMQKEFLAAQDQQRHDLQNYSDNNRKGMEANFASLKESIREELRLYFEAPTTPRRRNLGN